MRYLLSQLTIIVLFTVGCNSGSFSGEGRKTTAKKEKPSSGTDVGNTGQPQTIGADANTNTNANANPSATPSQPEPKSEAETIEEETRLKKPAFALLVNDLKCGMCHVKVNGSIVSTRDVQEIDSGSTSNVNGTWYVNGRWNALEVVNVTGGIKENYKGSEMPKDLDGDGEPDFPVFTKKEAQRVSKGKVTGEDADGRSVTITNVSNKSIALVGKDSAPIRIDGEVFIDGDLVITGTYTGVGSIYTTGNIYIPYDLVAKDSPFPISSPRDAEAKLKKDGLALATLKSIIIAAIPDKDSHSLFTSNATPPNQTYDALEVGSVFSWFSERDYKKLYGDAKECGRDGFIDNVFNREKTHALNQIDAYLYAKKSIAGMSRSSYTINGGVIADNFHIVSASEDCDTDSIINFDQRLKRGLPVLQALAPFFQEVTTGGDDSTASAD